MKIRQQDFYRLNKAAPDYAIVTSVSWMPDGTHVALVPSDDEFHT